ncbi:SAM-dependent methyltransferase, partial [Rhodococcus rhodochrous]
MGYEFTLADVAYLRSVQGTVDLAEVAARELSTRTRLADIGWARTRFAGRAAPLTETVLLRRRAVAKLPAGG